jgi:hypothetical protein
MQTNVNPAQTNEKKRSSNVGEIVGGAVGGFVVLVAVLVGIWWCVKLSRRRREAREQPFQGSEVRYSAAPTLVPSDYLGSPTKGMLPALAVYYFDVPCSF